MSAKFKVGAALIAAVLASGGYAYAASIPGSNGVIQGCYDNGGNVKVVSALPCAKSWTPLQWNQQGVKGDKGDKGDQGIQGVQGVPGVKGDKGDQGVAGVKGDKGDAGTGGLSTFYPVLLPEFSVGSGGRATESIGSINLPAGKYALVAVSSILNADGDQQSATCDLTGASFSGGATSFNFLLGGGGDKAVVSLATTATLSSAGTVTYECSGFRLVSEQGTLTALQVQ